MPAAPGAAALAHALGGLLRAEPGAAAAATVTFSSIVAPQLSRRVHSSANAVSRVTPWCRTVPSCRSPGCCARSAHHLLQAQRSNQTSAQPTTQTTKVAAGHTSAKARYHSLINGGEINKDVNQEKVIELLDQLSRTVAAYEKRGLPTPPAASNAGSIASASSAGKGFFSGFFKRAVSASPPKPAATTPSASSSSAPKGIYIWGGCGSGKTFLMDLFYETCTVKRKKRIHFHEWMIDVHERLHRLQKKNTMVQTKANTVWTAEAALAQQKELKKGKNASSKGESAEDLMAQVAKEMLEDAWLLCFDEFQVTHISDAIIMKRLFSVMFERGAVVFATSNRPPEDLYLNGLNRPLFLPFIPMLKDFCSVHDIGSSTDYRLITSSEEEDRRVYIHPNSKDTMKLLERKFHRLCHGETASGVQVEIQGRRVIVPRCAQHTNVGWFNFKDLCDRPLGAADYLGIASAFHTIFVADIPRMTLQERDQVRRFITMIDAFYDRHTKFVCTAETEPTLLFHVSEEDKKTSVADEIFAWDRTASRLIEMQSVKYLSEQARMLCGQQFLCQFNLQCLTDDDLVDMWRRYDRDDSGEIDEDELKFMLEDILERHQGHRHLEPEIYTLCKDTIDQNGDGVVQFQEFASYMKDFTTVSNTVRL